VAVLQKAWSSLNQLSTDILTVLTNTVSRIAEIDLSALLAEDWGRAAQVNNEGSVYIQSLRQHFTFFSTYLLPLYLTAGGQMDLKRQSAISSKLATLCLRIARLFVRYCSLVSNPHQYGRMKMASDMAQLESILTAHVATKSKVPDPFRLLHDFKELLFVTSPTKIPELLELKGSQLDRPSLIVYLFSNSRLVQSAPHTVLGVKPDELLRAVDKEPECYTVLTKAYEKLESKLKIPKGQSGKNFVEENYPELHLAKKLLPKP
jgi:hypothetical protein